MNNIFKKKGVKILAAFLLVSFSFFLVGTIWVPKTEWGRKTVRTLIKSTLEETIRGEVEFDIKSGNIFRDIVLKNITIKNEEGIFVASAGQLSAKYNPLGYLGGKIKIDSIEAKNLVLVVRREEKKTNFTNLFIINETPSTSELEINFEKMKIINGTFVTYDSTRQDKKMRNFFGDGKSKITYDSILGIVKTFKGPDENQHEVGPVFFTGIEAEFAMRVNTKSATSLVFSNLQSRLALDHIFKNEELRVEGLALIFPGKEMIANAKNVSVGKKIRTKAIEFQGIFPQIKDSKNWFDAHYLNIDSAEVSRGYVNRLSRESVDPKEKVVFSLATAGTLPGNFSINLDTEIARSKFQLQGGIQNWLSDHEVMVVDLVVGAEGVNVTDFIPLDNRYSLSGDIAIEGKLGDDYELDLCAILKDANMVGHQVEQGVLDIHLRKNAYLIRNASARLDGVVTALEGEVKKTGEFDLGFGFQTVGASKIENKIANSELIMHGKINWNADTPLDFVEHLQAEGEWNIDRFTAPKINIQNSKGKFELDYKRTPNKELNLSIDARGKMFSWGGNFAKNYKIKTKTKTRLAELEFETLLANSTTNFVIGASRIKAKNIKADAISIKGSVVPAKGKDTFIYQLHGGIGNLMKDTLHAKRARFHVKGRFRTDIVNREVKSFSSKGELDVRNLKHEEIDVNHLVATIDLKGTPRQPTGKVLFSTEEMKVAPYDLKKAEGEIRLSPRKEFQIDLRAFTKEDKKINTSISGNYRSGVHFDGLSLGENYKSKNGIRIQGDFIEFQNTEISSGEQKITIDGSFTKNVEQDLNIIIQKFDIQDVYKNTQLETLKKYRGKVNAELTLTGTAKNMNSNFDLLIEDLFIGKVGPFRVAAKGSYHHHQLNITTLELRYLDKVSLAGYLRLPIQIQQNGKTHLYHDRAIEGELGIRKFDVKDILTQVTKLESVDIFGVITSDLNLEGTIRNPKFAGSISVDALSLKGAIRSTPIEVGPFDGDISLDYDRMNGVRSMTKFVTEFGELEIFANTKQEIHELIDDFQRDPQGFDYRNIKFEAGLKTQSFEIEKLKIGPIVEAKAEGKIDVDMNFSGSLNSPDFSGNLRLKDFGWKRFRDINFETVFNIKKERLKIREMKFAWDGADMLEGDIDIPNLYRANELDDIPIRVALRFVPFKLSKLSAFDYQFASLKGMLAGEFLAEGSLRHLGLRSKLKVSDLVFADGTKGDAKVEITLDKSRLRGGILLEKIEESKAVEAGIQFDIPFVQNISKALEEREWFAKGNIKGRIFSPNLNLPGLFPAILYQNYISELKGKLASNILVGGTMEKPSFQGKLHFKDAAFTIKKYGRRLEELGIDIYFQNDHLRFENAKVHDGTGTVEGNGIFHFDGWLPGKVAADFKTKRFSIEGFSPIPAFVSTDLNISGNLTDPSVMTEIKVKKIEIILPEDQLAGGLPTELDEDIIVVEGKENEIQDILKMRKEIVDKVYAKLHVLIEKGEVIHPVGNVNFDGDLKVDLANIGALTRGDIRTLGGKVESFGKTFRVQKGIISFRGLDPPNPILQLEAHYKLSEAITEVIGPASDGNARAIVRIQGPVSEIKPQFSSNPSMSESDVIYVLITDQAPGSAGIGQAEAGLALGAASSGLTGLASMVVGSANKVLPEIAQVDSIRVKTGETEGKLEVGKYLSPKLFVLYRYRFGAEEGESEHEVKFEYRFIPSWILEVQVGDAAHGALNLLWDIY